MPDENSPRVILVSWMQLAAGTLAICATLLAGNVWVMEKVAAEVVGAALEKHTVQPHAMASPESRINQAVVSADLNNIRTLLIRIEGKVDKLEERGR